MEDKKVKGQGSVVAKDNRKYRAIITRFRNQDDLDVFAKKLGFDEGVLTNLTTEVHLPELEVKNKKPGRKRGNNKKWQETWKGMPHFINEKNEAYAVIKFFYDEDVYGIDGISEVMEQTCSSKSKSLWFPKWDGVGRERFLRVVGGNNNLKYPVYVISKNRSECCLTSKWLTACEVSHYVAVEPQEYDKYMGTVGQSPFTTVLQMDMTFQDNYDTHYELEPGEERKVGPGAVRNWVWYHSMTELGAKKHHVLDDNLNGFFLLSDNVKFKVRTGAFIRAFEDFVDAHTNVRMASPNYGKFALQNEVHPSHIYNTRMYSWQLITNDLWDEGIKWRGRYNEDTIISLDILEKGYSTLQTNFFLQDKLTTQTLKGGNTEEFYNSEGTYKKSKLLADLYPEVAKLVWKFSRWHHEVDYSKYATNDPGFDPTLLPQGTDTNDYGMYVVKIVPEDEYTVAKDVDTKSGLEERYGLDTAIYKFDGTRWQDGFDIFEDFKNKGY